jgi:tetratricopeptide (TPR) repeat protein
MKCLKCHFENTDTARYCSNCAAPLGSSEGIEITETLEAPKEALTSGSTFARRYEIVEELGKGGMGRVYRAFDNKVEEEIALKLLKPEIAHNKKTIKRFRNELKLARKITHKNVCRMFDFHEEEKTPFITMEYVQGESLKAFIQKQGILPEEKTINIAQQICLGLSEAHQIGVVHRDLKPQNIMMDLEGNAKIMDFGIAHFLEAEGVTQTGMIIGTPDYMSPEQVEGKKADQRSDIYSLGIILYEMVTGKVPFKGDTALSIALKHKTETPPDPRKLNDQVSDDLSCMILKCLEKDSKARFQSVDELLAELRNIEEGMPLTTGIKRPPMPGFLIEGEEGEMERPIFVAREEEINKLEGFLDQALSGKGRVVFVKGEAGSGKTALIQEFARRAQETHSELIVAGGNCNAHTGIGDPYLPFREVLALLTGDVEGRWKAGSISTDHARRLWHCLPLMAHLLVEKGPELIDTFIAGQELVGRAESYVQGCVEWLRKLRELVEHKAAMPVDPSLQQSVLLEQYARVLEALAESKSVILMLDDLQWVDNGSAKLLMHLAGRLKASPVLIVGAFRSEEVAIDRDGERHPMKSIINECKAQSGDIEVDVGRSGSREFVNAYLDNEPNQYSNAFRKSFLKHTEGHSLFTTEVLRGLKEQGALIQDEDGRWTESDIDWEKLPTRLEAMIGERIDRMPEALKDVLKVASIEGEYFSGEVVAGITKTDKREMVRLLSSELDKRYQLVNVRGIVHAGGKRLSQYRFRHILFQKYLYNSMDEVERAHQHEDVGNVLENLYGEHAGEISGQLARHFQEAGLTEKAIQYLQQAGNNAVQKIAYAEAIAHFRKALELLKKLPVTPERIGQELALQVPIALNLTNILGYADPVVGKAYSRAFELCKQIGETPYLIPVLGGLWPFYFTKAEMEPAVELAEQILRLAPNAEDPVMALMVGHNCQTGNLTHFGKFTQALEHANQVYAVKDPGKHQLSVYTGEDFWPVSVSWSAIDYWFLGLPDKGRKRLQEAYTFSRGTTQLSGLGFVLAWTVLFHQFCRDVEAVRIAVDEEIELSTEYGFQLWPAGMSVFQGWIMAEQGNPKEGIAQIHRGLEAIKATGTWCWHIHYLSMLAEAHKRAGQIDDGLATIEDSLALMEKTGQRYFDAELHRLKGEFLLTKSGAEDEVEPLFERAIDVARGQKAKSLELRATMSLARLWQKQGKKEEARKMLAEIYGWFTEGFDTQDLKNAKALLEELL